MMIPCLKCGEPIEWFPDGSGSAWHPACEPEWISKIRSARDESAGACPYCDVIKLAIASAKWTRDLDEARLTAEYWRDQVSSARGNPLPWETGNG